NISTLYRENRLKQVTDWTVLKSSACENALRAMSLLHDQLYGRGTGQIFLHGDYLADLPRAVRMRIKPVLESSPLARGDDADSVPTVGTLSAATELKVVGVAQNDVLHVREEPTEAARIIGMIPPDISGGVIYSGDSQGEWVFVRFQEHVE